VGVADKRRTGGRSERENIQRGWGFNMKKELLSADIGKGEVSYLESVVLIQGKKGEGR